MAENTIQRIKRYIDAKGIKVSALEKEVGMSNGSFASQLKNNKTIGVDKLENILSRFPDINLEWLLTGTGNMIKLDVLDEPRVVYNKTDNSDSENEINYKDLAEARKETIESLKKIIAYLEMQLAENNKNKK